MSQENVDLVLALHEAFNRGDFDGLVSKWSPECEYRAAITQVVEGEAGVFRGHDGLRRWWHDLQDLYDELSSEVLEVRGHGDKVVVVFIIRGRGKGSGIILEGQELTQVFTLRQGKVTRGRDYFNRDEALEAVGLSEQSMPRRNVELTRAYFEEIARASREDFDTEATIAKMAEYWDPEIEWDTRGGPVLEIAGVYRGIEGARNWCREWFTAWEALHFEYEVVDAEDRVVALLDMRMRGRSSGIEVAIGKHAWVITFRDGLMVHNKLYMSQSEALEAVGLSEQDAHADA